MKRKKIASFLEGARRDGSLVSLKRVFDDGTQGGFVIGLGEEWVLLHYLCGDWMRLNGYVALRINDILWVKADTTFATRSLGLRNEQPTPQPDILMVDLPGLLSSADAHFPLIGIHMERKFPGTMYLGRVSRITEKKAWLREISVKAQWREKLYSHRLSDITMIEFGAAYEDALWQVAEHDRRLAERKMDDE
jgi:hypothetical protein